MTDTISKSRVFLERMPQAERTSQAGEPSQGNKNMEVQCVYRKDTEALGSGSSSLCPATHQDATSGKYDITETSHDRMLWEMYYGAYKEVKNREQGCHCQSRQRLIFLQMFG